MLLFMLSLGGIPPTAGFMGKFWLFGAAIEAGYVWLAVIGVLNSAISLYYYVRLVVFMYLKKETIGSEPTISPSLTFALGVAVAATIVLGIYPRWLFEVAEASARTLGSRRNPHRPPLNNRRSHAEHAEHEESRNSFPFACLRAFVVALERASQLDRCASWFRVFVVAFRLRCRGSRSPTRT